MYNKLKTVANIFKKWTPLKALELKDADSCLELQDSMVARMKNKIYAFNYISRKNRSDFEKLIKNKELFGVYDKNNKLCGIVSIKKSSEEELLEILKYDGDNFSIPNELLNFLKLKNFYYLTDWMSDLSPKNVGIGKYMVNEVMKYLKKVLKADFSFATFEVSNSLSYKLLSKSNLSFAVSHKIVDFKNANGFKVKIPSILTISLLNKKLIKIFYKSLDLSLIKNFKYTKNMLNSIFLSNRRYDPILNRDELVVMFRNKIKKIKFYPDKLLKKI